MFREHNLYREKQDVFITHLPRIFFLTSFEDGKYYLFGPGSSSISAKPSLGAIHVYVTFK